MQVLLRAVELRHAEGQVLVLPTRADIPDNIPDMDGIHHGQYNDQCAHTDIKLKRQHHLLQPVPMTVKEGSSYRVTKVMAEIITQNGGGSVSDVMQGLWAENKALHAVMMQKSQTVSFSSGSTGFSSGTNNVPTSSSAVSTTNALTEGDWKRLKATVTECLQEGSRGY